MLTFDQIKELIELVAERDLGGLELERSGFRLEISGRPRAEAAPAAAPAAPAPPPSAAPATTAPPSGGDAQGTGAGGTAAAELDASHSLPSPIVGTFYRASSPDADPFVEVGDPVKAGQVLCIVEAMKLMNEIESDVAGTIVAIHPKNAQPVEYGEPLFSIRTG